MITKKTIKKISDLAHIELSDKEKEEISKNLIEILDYVDKLKKVDTSEVDFKSISPVKNKLRKDKVKDSKEKTKEVMRSMGKNKDNYFQVESI